MNWYLKIAQVSALNNIRPPSEDLYQVMEANMEFGMIGPDEMVNITDLSGGIGLAADDQQRVKSLADMIASPNGYVERIIVDDQNNVIEGQHRLDALRALGVQQVPVKRLIDISRAYNTEAMRAAARAVTNMHPDQAYYLVNNALEAIAETGSPEAALQEYEMGGKWNEAWKAALQAARLNSLS